LSNFSANAVVDRLHAVYGVKTDNELSSTLQVKRSTLGNWRSRDAVPYAICVNAAKDKGVSLDWLITGVGPMMRGENVTGVTAATDNPREQAILALYRELDEAGKRDIQNAAEEKKRMKTLEQRIKELEAVVEELKRLA